MSNLQVHNIAANTMAQQLNRPQKFSKPETVSPLGADSVELSTKSKGLSKKTKLAVILGAIGIVGTAVALILRGKFSKAVELAEHIEFTRASSIEEAIEFGQKHFGIQNYKNFTENDLEVLNWINEGLTIINNKFKGKVKIPRTIEYLNEAESKMIACVRSGRKKWDSWLGINKHFFDNIDNLLDKEIKNFTVDLDKFDPKTTEGLKELMQKYKQGELTSLNDKKRLYENLIKIESEASQNPVRVIQEILSNPEAKQKLIDKGILYGDDHNKIKFLGRFEVDLNEDLSKQMDPRFVEYLKEVLAKETGFKMKHNEQSQFRTIFHEIGHYNDKVRSELESATGSVEFFDKLKAWNNNNKDFSTAYTVSDYASTSPSEFVAEVFAELVSGHKMSDEVMELYNRLGGKLVA